MNQVDIKCKTNPDKIQTTNENRSRTWLNQIKEWDDGAVPPLGALGGWVGRKQMKNFGMITRVQKQEQEEEEASFD